MDQESGQPAENPPVAGSTPPAGSGGAEQTPGPVPYERFKAVNEQLAELKRWKDEQDQAAAKAKKDQEAAEAARLVEQNQFKTLAEQRAAKLAELEPLGERVKTLETVLQGVYEARLADLSPAAKKAVESLPGLTLEQRLAWLNENGALFAKPTAPNINATTSGGRGEALSDADAEELAAIYGVRAKYLTK